MRPGTTRPIEIDVRHGLLTASESIKDVYDGLRELVTNSDDSYYEMGKEGGPIVIEVSRRRNQSHIIRVKDRAAGMTLAEMDEKIGRVGRRTSVRGGRGFFARGGRDVAILGDVTYESIKDGHYHKAHLSRTWDYTPWVDEGKRGGSPIATKEDKERLGIRSTGTVVTWEPQVVPHVRTLKEQLRLFWPLRDIISEDSACKVEILDGNEMLSERICYRRPEADLVIDEEYPVPGYDGVSATFQLYRAPEPLKDSGDRFRHTGILVKAERAIHECSFLLARELENDQLAARYFGRIQCSYIDELCEEMDQIHREGLEFPPHNPEFLIDPQRHKGLSRSHPFTQELFKHPTEVLRAFVAEDRKALSQSTENIGNKDLQRRLNQLAKAAATFLEDEAEPLDWVSDDDDVDIGMFKKGVLIVPTYANVPVNGERRLTLYALRSLPADEDTRFSVEAQSDAVEVLQDEIVLRPHKKREEMLLGTITLRGVRVENEGILITAKSDGRPSAEALVSVVPEHPTQRVFTDPLEFEHKTLKIREGRRRTVKLFAKYPELVTGSTTAEVSTSCPEDLVVRGAAVLAPISGTNYAVADVTLEARRQVAGAVKLTAKVNEAVCSASVQVVQDEAKGPQLDFKFVDKHLYGFRAAWGDAEGKPNLLEISAQHKSVKRYLGSAPDYPGQSTSLCRLLVAEIVAEAVCRRTLSLQAATRGWEFDWTRSGDNEEIGDSVMREFNKLMEKFLPVAHTVMLSDADVRAVLADTQAEDNESQLTLVGSDA